MGSIDGSEADRLQDWNEMNPDKLERSVAKFAQNGKHEGALDEARFKPLPETPEKKDGEGTPTKKGSGKKDDKDDGKDKGMSEGMKKNMGVLPLLKNMLTKNDGKVPGLSKK